MLKNIHFLALGPIAGLMIIAGCATERSSSNASSDAVSTDLSKYRLEEDRKKFDEIRAEIPAVRQSENDEIALRESLMGEIKRPPQDIRNKHDSMLSKKRNQFNKDMDKVRKVFSDKEKRDKEDFVSQLNSDKKDFLSRKQSSEDRKRFFEDSDTKRRSYFSEYRTKRDDFEADMRDRRKDFEDYVKEKNNEFNQDLKAYTQRWNEYQKNKSLENSP